MALLNNSNSSKKIFDKFYYIYLSSRNYYKSIYAVVNCLSVILYFKCLSYILKRSYYYSYIYSLEKNFNSYFAVNNSAI